MKDPYFDIETLGFKQIRLSDGLYIIHLYSIDDKNNMMVVDGKTFDLELEVSTSYAHQRQDGRWIYTFGYDTSETMTGESFDTVDLCCDAYQEMISEIDC